eukprot:TRINITY_DN45028_c0_g1_i1.p1 TRINITY_DN45028_c0_g1~~TRINITY_DN45028_c0_g1_i1.p1  ORF type:complete len:149 (-),score=12.17 TRINITY_DN45028_c0_g1_i1:276-722(-)
MDQGSKIANPNLREIKQGEKPEVQKSESEWKIELEPQVYRTLREEDTERPWTSKFNDFKETGVYKCAGCGQELYASTTKFESGCGWPAFSDSKPGAVLTKTDTSIGMIRTEILCSKCHGHLGHVFDDGPQPTGIRHCVNGCALNFTEG